VEHIMGTAICLDLTDPLPADRLGHLADLTFDWFREVDRRFSTYLPDSEVNRVRRGELTADRASPDLRYVLERCADLWRDTDGYFDAYATGQLDPSGFVKGWSVRVASERLAEAGCVNHCVNAGGDVQVRGHERPDVPWRIGIRHPWLAHRVCWILEATDLAVATSGTYERGPHVIDPHRGVPATALRSVTVTGADLGTADAYATAALAMGTAGPEWLATLPGYECAVVTEAGNCLRSEDLPLALGPLAQVQYPRPRPAPR
jgi:thiamine biosynthesis lipoprotein